LQKHSSGASAIWIDKDSAGLIEEGWLDMEPQKNYAIVTVGYTNALYSFRDVLSISKISGPYVDWTKEEVEPGFSVWKLKDDSTNSLNATMRGYRTEVNIEALFIATNRLLEKENYRIAEVFEEECSIHSDCQPRFEYAILSHCPYESRCIDRQCAVVCPYISDPEWFRAILAISNCEAETIFQGHDLFVMVNLKNGEKIGAFEPAIDDVIKIADAAEEKCGKIMIGTE
jgi:hypothetical protein